MLIAAMVMMVAAVVVINIVIIIMVAMLLMVAAFMDTACSSWREESLPQGRDERSMTPAEPGNNHGRSYRERIERKLRWSTLCMGKHERR